MNIALITGFEGVAGVEQGYRGLPYRRINVPDTVQGGEVPAIQTAWLPTPLQMALLHEGAAVLVTTLGGGIPPMQVDVEPGPHQVHGSGQEVVNIDIAIDPNSGPVVSAQWRPGPEELRALLRGAPVEIRIIKNLHEAGSC